MHISYKFGLFLLFILNLSFNHILAAPAINNNTSPSEDDDEYPDDDYDDYYNDKTAAVRSPASYEDEEKPNILTSTAVSLSNSLLSLFAMPSAPARSNHVVQPVCPKSCLCLQDFKYIDCSHGRLTAVPQDIPTSAAIIDLSHNRINAIKKMDFSQRLKLQEINLNNNLIDKVEKEMFENLPRLLRLRLASNRLSSIEPDTFRGASDLTLLDLSNNSIQIPEKGPFLNQRSLLELNCRNCSWSQLYDDTFTNMSSLTALRIDQNDFEKKINTKAFLPLKNLIKLRLPELDQGSTEELCNILKNIDNISFKRFDVSCYELVLGASFNDSIFMVTEPSYAKPTGTVRAALETINDRGEKDSSSIMSSSSSNVTLLSDSESANDTEIIKASMGILGTEVEPTKEDIKPNEEESYQVSISQEAINYMLIGLMVISIIGIIIGIIFRKDVGGIKTKCCRTKKSMDEKNIESNGGVAPEEVPLNKLNT